MLQGYEIVTTADIECSSKFLKAYIEEGKIEPEKAIDCGGGIGRVSRELLTKFFNKVDIVDQAVNLIEAAKTSIKSERMRNFYVSGLQDFEFPDIYNCIWIQWVLMHIPDKDAIDLLKKCKKSIAEKGVLVVKENEGIEEFIVDKTDYSITRTEAMHKNIFKAAGVEIIEVILQDNFPVDLLPVKLYVLN